jgi:hypothetical protein
MDLGWSFASPTKKQFVEQSMRTFNGHFLVSKKSFPPTFLHQTASNIAGTTCDHKFQHTDGVTARMSAVATEKRMMWLYL